MDVDSRMVEKEQKIAYLRFKLGNKWLRYTVRFPSKRKRDAYMLMVVGKVREHGGSTGHRVTKKMINQVGIEIAEKVKEIYT